MENLAPSPRMPVSDPAPPGTFSMSPKDSTQWPGCIEYSSSLSM